jgi:hypothetical protein
MTLCVQTVVTASILLGNLNLHGGAAAIAIFFIIFPNVPFLVLLFTPPRVFGAPDVTGGKLPSVPSPAPAAPLGAVSPAKRFWALVLAIGGPFVGLNGLHRFYVGKIGTGILWLFTGGLAGIGQFIDIIMIAIGQFEDKNGLPLVHWHDPAKVSADAAQGPKPERAAAVSGQPQAQPAVEPAQAETPPTPPAPPEPASTPSYASTGTIIYEPWHPFSGLICALGHIFILAAIVVGLAVGLHLPSVVAAGWPNPEIGQELDRVFGYAEWPRLLESGGAILIVALLFVAAICVMVGRRKSGPAHLIRALLGVGGFFWAIQLFRSEAISSQEIQGIVERLEQNQVGLALERLFGAFGQEEAIFAGVIALASVLIMAWPPRRQTPVFAPMPNQGVL